MQRALVVMVMMSGCSIVMARGPEQSHDARRPPRCSDVNPLVIASDVVIAGLVGLVAGIALIRDHETGPMEVQRDPLPSPTALGLTSYGFAMSSLYGLHVEHRCGDAYESWQSQRTARMNDLAAPE